MIVGFSVFVVIVMLSIIFEKVTEIVEYTETAISLSVGEVDKTVGGMAVVVV